MPSHVQTWCVHKRISFGAAALVGCVFVLVFLPLSTRAAGPRLVLWGQGECGELLVVPPCGQMPHGEDTGLARTGAIDPSLPSVVLIHGFNPFPRMVRFDLGPAARTGPLAAGESANLLVWDWNLATKASLRPRVNVENASRQGRMLADALHAAGVAPSRTHLVAHSLGCVVAAASARHGWELTGQRTARVTLLDALASNHEVLFDAEGLAESAEWVENRWSPGLSGFGAPAFRDGVVDLRTPGRTPWRGLLLAHRMNHVDVLRRYLAEGDDSHSHR